MRCAAADAAAGVGATQTRCLGRYHYHHEAVVVVAGAAVVVVVAGAAAVVVVEPGPCAAQ